MRPSFFSPNKNTPRKLDSRKNENTPSIASVWPMTPPAVFENGGRRHRPNTGDGRRVFVFSRIELPGGVFVRREKTRTHGTLGVGVSRISRLVALRLFHRCDGRMDATS